MTSVLYDNLGINKDILLDLPFREGVGVITNDVAKPHHPVTLVGAPTWTARPSGLMGLTLDGLTEYLQCLAAQCADLDFTNGDYSLGGWIDWTVLEFSQIIMGRYQLDSNGWELYLYNDGATNLLTLRHHHSAGASVRSACYSEGWTPGTPWFYGISRSGDTAFHYRNGEPLETTHSVGGLIDPETCNQDLVIGVRTTKDANFFKGWRWRPRVWGRAVPANQWKTMYDFEKGWFA